MTKNRQLLLTESDIRYAMDNTTTNTNAAMFLNISFSTYEKYAKMYVDEASRKTLWDLHKEKKGSNLGIEKKRRTNKAATLKHIIQVLNGEHPGCFVANLLPDLIREGFKPDHCEKCGFDERRITDYEVPIMLVCKDGNERNHLLENLEVVCFNCAFLYYGNHIRRRLKFRSKRLFRNKFEDADN